MIRLVHPKWKFPVFDCRRQPRIMANVSDRKVISSTGHFFHWTSTVELPFLPPSARSVLFIYSLSFQGRKTAFFLYTHKKSDRELRGDDSAIYTGAVVSIRFSSKLASVGRALNLRRKLHFHHRYILT